MSVRGEKAINYSLLILLHPPPRQKVCPQSLASLTKTVSVEERKGAKVEQGTWNQAKLCRTLTYSAFTIPSLSKSQLAVPPTYSFPVLHTSNGIYIFVAGKRQREISEGERERERVGWEKNRNKNVSPHFSLCFLWRFSKLNQSPLQKLD